MVCLHTTRGMPAIARHRPGSRQISKNVSDTPTKPEQNRMVRTAITC